jgi:hypothetical protein
MPGAQGEQQLPGFLREIARERVVVSCCQAGSSRPVLEL